MNLGHYSRYEISHTLIALLLLNKFIIFFHGNLTAGAFANTSEL